MNNRLTKRLNVLFGEIKGGGVFADVGCDHGYIAEKVIENAFATKVIISDISEKCLNKAVKRLNENYKGMFTAVVSDGFDELPHVDEALISGMGGEIIIKMLSRREDKPSRLILQPMKNSEALREYVIGNGYKIVRDYTFKDRKYYHVIVAEKSDEKDFYTADELMFGRDNLREKSSDFKSFIEDKITLFSEASSRAFSPEKEELEKKLEKLKEIIK